jgi:hypothetical protein
VFTQTHKTQIHKYKQLDTPSINRRISACDVLALLFTNYTANKSEKDCNQNTQANGAPETITNVKLSSLTGRGGL